jgi:general secretion pathway protein H
VAAALRLTRDKAVAESRTTRFVADAGTFGAGDGQHSQHIPPGVSLVLLADGRSKSPEPSGTIRFYPDSSSTGGRIALTAGTTRYTVVVNWFNGDVTIQSEAAPLPH